MYHCLKIDHGEGHQSDGECLPLCDDRSLTGCVIAPRSIEDTNDLSKAVSLWSGT